ncbi:MAG: DeoR/GlpR family DNA-binding transcription regulator [Clostridiales bacterium]|nr:DeoR/GlpR family DNA-binding transcription regulator [Clostridiales bacterium]
MNKRENTILQMLSEQGKMEVAALARTLGVSAVTVRKDLDELERRGVIRREHGYAIFGGNDDVNNRLAYHYEEKRRIAREAAKLVAVGETVMIENGSCCALLAEEVARTRPGAIIISNSAFIASYIRRIEGAHVVLLGGDFQNDAQVMVGPVLRTCAEQFYVDKLFVGVDGYDDRLGFMANNHLRAQAVRDMARQAKKVIAVTESSKFDRTSTVPLALPGGVWAAITDSSLPAESEEMLRRAGVRVYRAE